MNTIPLSKGSTIKIYNPGIDFFLDKIEAGEDFSFSKQLHGFWDDILAAMIVEPNLRKIRYTDDYLQQLSEAMVGVKHDRSSLRYTPSLYFDILKLMLRLDQMPDNFYFGVSDVDFYTTDIPPYSINSYIPTYNNFKLLSTNSPLKCRMMRCGDRQLMIEHFLPKHYIPFNGILWRRYSYNGLLEGFFEKVKHSHTIVIVGPDYFKDFGTLLKINRFHYIPVHGVAASEKKEELLQTILQHSQTLNNEPTIYFFVAGVLSIWLIHQLHHQLSKSYLIDAGQALDAVIPSKQMKTTTEFQLLGYKKGENFKTYKTANPNYFVEKEQGNRIVVTDEKEVVFLDKKRSLLSCYFVSLQTKFLYFVYHKAKVFRYADNPFIKNAIRLVRYMNYLLKSK
ncbi:MAG: hypothetical protein R3E32_18200 [Chitinophagales bacterium]